MGRTFFENLDVGQELCDKDGGMLAIAMVMDGDMICYSQEQN